MLKTFDVAGLDDKAYYTDSDPVDLFLGIGSRNQEKKAAKKIKKAEKQLEKGHTKAAERKLKKAGVAQEKVQRTQSATIAALNTQGAILAGKDQIEAAKVALSVPKADANVSAQAYDPLNSLPQSAASNVTPESGGGGGGGGDTSTYSDPSTDEPTGGLANVKDLPGVTVTNSKNKTGLYVVIGVMLLLLVTFGAKFLKSKK